MDSVIFHETTLLDSSVMPHYTHIATLALKGRFCQL